MEYNINNNITTEHIQQCLDENKLLILRILENQEMGKMSECAENQAKLQRNLMYLAAIADIPPYLPTTPYSQPPSMVYTRSQQAQPMTAQSLMATRSMLYAQQSPLQQNQTLRFMMGSGGNNEFPQMPYADAANSSNNNQALTPTSFADPSCLNPTTDSFQQQAASRGMGVASMHEVGTNHASTPEKRQERNIYTGSYGSGMNGLALGYLTGDEGEGN